MTEIVTSIKYEDPNSELHACAINDIFSTYERSGESLNSNPWKAAEHIQWETNGLVWANISYLDKGTEITRDVLLRHLILGGIRVPDLHCGVRHDHMVHGNLQEIRELGDKNEKLLNKLLDE
jgi:hypothetical protein